MKSSPIDRPQPLAAIVADRLRASILNCDVALGEALSEEKIATAMGVSRTPVREALTLLQMQGLIVILPRRGSFVFKPSQQDLRSLVEYRLNLELLTARWAVERAPVALHRALSTCLKSMEKARASDNSRAYAEADTGFHNAFFDYCGNALFVEAFQIVAGRLAALRAHLSDQLGLHRQKTFEEHQKMVDAAGRRDIDGLCALLRSHIEAMEPNYADALQKFG